MRQPFRWPNPTARVLTAQAVVVCGLLGAIAGASVSPHPGSPTVALRSGAADRWTPIGRTTDWAPDVEPVPDPTPDPVAPATPEPVPSVPPVASPAAQPAPPEERSPAAPPVARATVGAAADSASPPPPSGSDLAAPLFALLNRDRTAAGLAPLTWDGSLAAIADRWARQMAATASLTHQDLGGVLASLGWHMLAENIFAGRSDPTTAEAAWMASPDHRANILNGALTRVGIGVAVDGNGQIWAVQDFGTP